MPKRYALPKRFNAALSENAYEQLRKLNQQWGLGNNYLLVVLLEKLEEYADQEKLDQVFADFINKYGAPPGGIKR